MELLFEAIPGIVDPSAWMLRRMIFDILAVPFIVSNLETIGLHFRGRASL